MGRILLIDRSGEHGAALKAALLHCGFEASIENQWKAAQTLRQRVPVCDFVVVVGYGAPDQELSILRMLVESSHRFNQSMEPCFLFAAISKYELKIRLQIEELGVRYVRI